MDANPAHPWPPDLDRLIDELVGPPRPAPLERASGRWWVGELALSSTESTEADVLERLVALAPFALPEIVGRSGPWLVTRRPPGLAADRPDQHPEPGTLARATGVGLAALHAIDPTALGFGSPEDAEAAWSPIIDRCRAAVEAGLVDPGELPAPYDRYQPTELLQHLMVAEAGSGRDADRAVVCHGAPSLDRVLVAGDDFSGFDGFESLVVADRHLDLAIAHLSVAAVLGAEAVIGLYEGYGTDPDLARLDRAVLAAHLLGRGSGPTEPVVAGPAGSSGP